MRCQSLTAAALVLLCLAALAGCEESSSPAPPVLHVNGPSVLAFEGTADEAAGTASLAILNDGGGTLTFQVTANVAWLTATPSSSTVSSEQTVTVSLSATCGARGQHRGTVTVHGAGSTASIPVTLSCAGGELRVSPTQLPSFTYNVGEEREVSLRVSNAGDARMAWQAHLDIGGGDWLELVPRRGLVGPGGGDDATLTVRCIEAGARVGVVVVEGAGDEVRLEVEQRCQGPELGVSDTVIDLGTGYVGQDDPLMGEFSISNIGGGQLHYEVASSEPWLMFSLELGTLAAGESVDVPLEATCNRAGDWAAALTVSCTEACPAWADPVDPARQSVEISVSLRCEEELGNYWFSEWVIEEYQGPLATTWDVKELPPIYAHSMQEHAPVVEGRESLIRFRTTRDAASTRYLSNAVDGRPKEVATRLTVGSPLPGVAGAEGGPGKDEPRLPYELEAHRAEEHVRVDSDGNVEESWVVRLPSPLPPFRRIDIQVDALDAMPESNENDNLLTFYTDTRRVLAAPAFRITFIPVHLQGGQSVDLSPQAVARYVGIISSIWPVAFDESPNGRHLPGSRVGRSLSAAGLEEARAALTQRWYAEAAPGEFYLGIYGATPHDPSCGIANEVSTPTGPRVALARQLPSPWFGGLDTVVGKLPALPGHLHPSDLLCRSYVAHELGHSIGLKHVLGCLSTPPHDPFPYSDAGLGPHAVWWNEGRANWDFYTAPQLMRFPHGHLVTPMKGLVLARDHSGRRDNSLDGTRFHDIMSYCQPQLVSDHTYRRAWDLLLTGPVSESSPADSERGLRTLAISGTVRDGQWELTDAAETIPPPIPEAAADGSHLLQLLDTSGNVVKSMPLNLHSISHVPDKVWGARLAAPVEAVAIVIRDPADGRPLLQRDIAD